jgi:hypothetical protein
MVTYLFMVGIINLQLLLQIVPLMEDEQCLGQKAERKVTSQAKKKGSTLRGYPLPHHQKLT